MFSGEGSYSAVDMESSSGSPVLLVLTKDILAACAHAWNIAGAQEKGPEALPTLSGKDILGCQVWHTCCALHSCSCAFGKVLWDGDRLGCWVFRSLPWNGKYVCGFITAIWSSAKSSSWKRRESSANSLVVVQWGLRQDEALACSAWTTGDGEPGCRCARTGLGRESCCSLECRGTRCDSPQHPALPSPLLHSLQQQPGRDAWKGHLGMQALFPSFFRKE